MKNRDRAKEMEQGIEMLKLYLRQTSHKDGDVKAEIREEIADLQHWVDRLMKNPDSDDPNTPVSKSFNIFWQQFNKTEEKLSDNQLERIQAKIENWDKKGVKYSSKVNLLRRQVPKLNEEWKAERVVRTEDKRNESDSVKQDAEELGFKTFKIMLSNRACKTCRKFTDNGTKIFRSDEMKKNGWDVPPIHPNCSCIALPHE